MRYLFIQDWQSEAYHQHQNPAERRYQDLKRIANCLMDRTGSPPSLWLLALQYTAFFLNHTSCASLDKAIPMTILTGVTQDISILLRFHWYEKVYFRANESSFPSESPEQSGYFVGFAENVGNALTFAILIIDTNKIIYRSEVRSATDPKSINLQSDNWGVHQQDKPETEEIIKSHNDGSNKPPMAYIDTEDLVGKTFNILEDDNGNISKLTVIDAIKNHEDDTKHNTIHTKFRVQHEKNNYEDILT